MNPPKQNKLFKTIEIQKIDKQKIRIKLVKYLFLKFLIDDDLFHYFFEPEIIIRVSEPKVLKDIEEYLTQKQYKYFTYDYPAFEKKAFYGASPSDKSIYNNLMQLYHLHALAALTFNKKELKWYTNRTIHCLYNMRGFEYIDEVAASAEYAYGYALIDKKYDHDKKA